MYEVIGGEVVSDRMIAANCTKTPSQILGPDRELMLKLYLTCQTKGYDVAIKSLPDYDLSRARFVMNNLIENGYRIVGERDGRLKIGLAVFPEGVEPPSSFDETENIEGVEFDKKGVDGFGELIGSRRAGVEWIARMVRNIKERELEEEVPF